MGGIEAANILETLKDLQLQVICTNILLLVCGCTYLWKGSTLGKAEQSVTIGFKGDKVHIKQEGGK